MEEENKLSSFEEGIVKLLIERLGNVILKTWVHENMDENEYIDLLKHQYGCCDDHVNSYTIMTFNIIKQFISEGTHDNISMIKQYVNVEDLDDNGEIRDIGTYPFKSMCALFLNNSAENPPNPSTQSVLWLRYRIGKGPSKKFFFEAFTSASIENGLYVLKHTRGLEFKELVTLHTDDKDFRKVGLDIFDGNLDDLSAAFGKLNIEISSQYIINAGRVDEANRRREEIDRLGFS